MSTSIVSCLNSTYWNLVFQVEASNGGILRGMFELHLLESGISGFDFGRAISMRVPV